MTNAVMHKSNDEAGTFIIARDLMSELTGVVNTLGGKKVIVAFSGTSAFCDPSLSFVNIPALPEIEKIPLQVARQIRGFAAHEAAHIAFTDAHVDITTRTGEKNALQHSLWNCIEDYMIENYWLALYPGARKNFAATEQFCCEEYLKSVKKNPESVMDLRIIGGVALTWMRSLYFGLGVQASRDCLNTLPDDHKMRVQRWFNDLVIPVETTQECLEAAWQIYEEINQNPISQNASKEQYKKLTGQPKPDPMGKPSQGQSGQGQGQSGQSQGQSGQGQGQSGQGQGQAGQGQQNQGQGQSGQSGAKSLGSGSSTGSANQAGQGQDPNAMPSQQGGGVYGGMPDPNATGPGAATGGASAPQANFGPQPTPMGTGFDILKALGQAKIKPSAQNYISTPVYSTKTEGPRKFELAHKSGTQESSSLSGQLKGITSQTSGSLRRSLKTFSKNRTKTGRLDGKIDSRRLAFAASGSLEYHSKTVKGLDVDTAVSILVDCSGSMNATRMMMCQKLALVLEDAFSGTPVKHEILGYTTSDDASQDPAQKIAQQAHKKRNSSANFRDIAMYEFRSFKDRYQDALLGLGNMRRVPQGGTPTSPAMLYAHDRLAKRKERRHVLFVLTDGSSDDSSATLAAAKLIASCGVTVVGIGINTASVSREFEHYTVLNSIEKLPDLMLQSLTSIILGEKGKKGMNSLQVAQKRRVSA